MLLLLVLVPLPYGTVEPWSIGLWELCVLLLLVLRGVQLVTEPPRPLSLPLLFWPMAAWLVLVVLQLFSPGGGWPMTLDRYATTQALVRLLISLFLFLLFVDSLRTDDRRYLTAHLLLGISVLIALVGIGQSFIGKALWQRGAFGPFVNRNHFAGFLVMGASLAGGLLIGRGVRRELIAAYASSLLVLCAGIVLSASRGGMVAMVAGILFLAIVLVPIARSSHGSGRANTRWRTIVLQSVGALVLGLAAILGSLWLVGSEGLVRNLSQTGAEVAGEERPIDERFSRRDIWTSTIRLIAHYPWFGVGLGAFPVAYSGYDSSSGAQRVEQTHNDYLQVLADTGHVGGAIVLAFIIILFFGGLRTARAAHRSPRRQSVILGALTGCFAIAIHSFVDFNLQITSNAQFFIALAVLTLPLKERLASDGE